jgi:hypothetical protein
MAIVAVRLSPGCARRAAPCIRHLPFGIADDRHGFPLLVFAPQRGDRCMGNCLCMGLPLVFVRHPTPRLNSTDDGSASRVDMDVFDRDFLLALASMPVQGISSIV